MSASDISIEFEEKFAKWQGTKYALSFPNGTNSLNAAMYGIGVRLDENPFYFFELRGIDVDRFISVALESKVERMLSNADKTSDRVIDDADLTALFGVI